MRRHLVLLLVVGLVVGALAPAQAAKKKKKPKPKPPVPVAVDVTYNVVWSEEVCALSVAADLANPDASCGDPFAGSTTGPLLGSGEPVVVAAVDGLPLTLDASKKITGKLQMGSYTLAALADAGAGQPLGAGEAEWHVVLSGTTGGSDVTIGEATTTPYLVTPGNGDYEVVFEITPDAALTGKVFETFSMSLEQVGSATVHGALSADATSQLKLGAFVLQ